MVTSRETLSTLTEAKRLATLRLPSTCWAGTDPLSEVRVGGVHDRMHGHLISTRRVYLYTSKAVVDRHPSSSKGHGAVDRLFVCLRIARRQRDERGGNKITDSKHGSPPAAHPAASAVSPSRWPSTACGDVRSAGCGQYWSGTP